MVRNIVDASAIRDIQDSSVFDGEISPYTIRAYKSLYMSNQPWLPSLPQDMPYPRFTERSTTVFQQLFTPR